MWNTKHWFVDDDWTIPGWFVSAWDGTGTTGTIYLTNISGDSANPSPVFVVGELLESRFWTPNGIRDVWYKITAVGAITDDEVVYGYEVVHGDAVDIPKAAGAVSWGLVTGGQLLHLVSEIDQGAYIETIAHDGEPWKDQRKYVRIGSLGGFAGITDYEEIGFGLQTDPANPTTTPSFIASNKRDPELFGIGLTLANLVDGQRVTRGRLNPAAEEVDYICWLGGTEGDPGFWVLGDGTTGIRDDVLIGSRASTLFTSSGGALLLGPNVAPVWTRSGAYWQDSRGRNATVTGTFHLSPGRWPGTRALSIIPAVTNLIPDPIAGAGDVAETFWGFGADTTHVRSTTHPVRETHCWKLSAAFLTPAEEILMSHSSPVSLSPSPSVGTYYCFSVALRVAPAAWHEGSDYQVELSITESGNAHPATTVKTIPSGTEWQRFWMLHAISESGVTGLTVKIRSPYLEGGDYLYVDAVDLTATAYAPPHVDGYMPGASWSGTENESTSSTGTKTTLDLANMVEAVNNQPELTFHAVVQMPCGYRSTDVMGSSPYLYVFDMADNSGTASTRLYLLYNNSTEQWQFYAQGGVRLSSVAGAHQFEEGDWVELILAVSTTANTAALYADSVLLASGLYNGTVPNVTKWKLGDSYSAGSHGKGQGFSQFAVFHEALSANWAAAILRLNAPLMDMSALEQSLGIRFPLHNSAAGVDTPGISWSDGNNLVSVEPNDNASAKTLELELKADAKSTYTAASLKLTATVDGGNSTSLTVADDGATLNGILAFTGTMGNSTKAPQTVAPDDWVEVKIGTTTLYVPAYAAS